MHQHRLLRNSISLGLLVGLFVCLIVLAVSVAFRTRSVPAVLLADLTVLLTAAVFLYGLFFSKKYNRAARVEQIGKTMFGSPENAMETIGKYNGLLSIIENIESNEPFTQILAFIYTSFAPYIPYSHIGVALVGGGGQTIRASYAVSSELHAGLRKRFMGYETELAATSLMQVLSSGSPRVINDLEAYLKGKEVHEYNRILLEEGIRSSISFPLSKNGIPIGIIFFSSSQKNVYRAEHVEFLRVLANSIMLSLERDLLLDDMVVSSTLALATLAEERDNVTGNHLQRMKQYSTLLAKLLMKEGTFADQIDTDFIKGIERFAPLHDIGKVAISDSILLKPGRLTPEEFEIMKTHTTYGGNVLRLADQNAKVRGRSIFRMGIEITEGHHEWWNGSGYPRGRSGENIPLNARIVAVADVFDALTSKRPYKDGFSFERSAAIVLGEAGTHFDPRIIKVFQKHQNDFRTMCAYYQKIDFQTYPVLDGKRVP